MAFSWLLEFVSQGEDLVLTSLGVPTFNLLHITELVVTLTRQVKKMDDLHLDPWQRSGRPTT